MLIDDLTATFAKWIDDLQQYSIEQLTTRPDSQSWSLGQVYMHLIEETKFYMEQMEACMKYNDNALEHMDERGKIMFANNSFPYQRIKGDPFISDRVPQPESKEQLQKDILHLRGEVIDIGDRVISSQAIGKTAHPGHGYFSAVEWLQYAEMHMRHHLKQKKRLEEGLKLADRSS